MINHPYNRLSDERGSLTRYPLDICFLPYDWVKEFTSLGGNFDSYGVYGVSPTEEYLVNFSPAFVAKIYSQSNKRWDRVPCLSQISKVVKIDESCDLVHLKLLHYGACFVEYCMEHYGFNPLETGKSIFACARMYKDVENVDTVNWCLQNAKKVSLYIIEVLDIEQYTVPERLKSSLMKGIRRIKLLRLTEQLRQYIIDKNIPIKSMEVFTYCIRKFDLYRSSFHSFCFLEDTYYYVPSLPNVLFVNGKITYAESYAGYFYIEDNDTGAVMAWKDNPRHRRFLENKKQILKLFKTVNLSLKGVYGKFCYNGILDFLKENYISIYELFKHYESYDEVPEELRNRKFAIIRGDLPSM